MAPVLAISLRLSINCYYGFMLRNLFLFLAVIALPSLAVWAYVRQDFGVSNYEYLAFIFLSHLLILLIFIVIAVSLKSKASSLSAESVNELLNIHEQFDVLYENSPVPYVSMNKHGKIELYNLAAVRLFETTTDALLGKDLTARFVSDEKEKLGVLLGKIRMNVPVTDYEIQVKAESGTFKWVSLSIFSHSRSKKKMASLVDITEKKIIDNAKSEFVALATHQLRTPIAAIKWNIELMERKLNRIDFKEHVPYLEKISRNVSRMIALINDFLSVSKLETGTFAAHKEEFVLDEYFSGIVDEYAGVVAGKQIQLETACIPQGFVYKSDTRLLHIITSNLLSNAVKYVPDGGTIKWGYRIEGDKLIIEVADSGIGIPEKEQSQLFSKFFRASNAQMHQAEGTGLGLYIVAQSVEKLGGTITAESVENEGTIFTVTLPANT